MKRTLIFAATASLLLASGCARRTAAIPVAPSAPTQQVFARQVREARIAGEGDPAVRILRQRLAAAPGSIDLRLELARHYESTGSPDLALEHVRFARAQAPAQFPLAAEEARLLIKLDLPDEAVAALGPVAASPAAPASIRSWLGIALDESGDLAAGESAHRAALNLSPADDTLLNNLGFNLLRQGRPEEAIRFLQSAVELNRDNALARSNLARALAARAADSDASGAVAHWSAAIDPASAHSNLAAALIERGQYDQARRQLDAALAIERQHLAAWNNLRLVSELDGLPATPAAVRQPGPWKRFASMWKNAFGAGSSGRNNEGPDQRASR
jgi:Flp pilus assembly protein TadD